MSDRVLTIVLVVCLLGMIGIALFTGFHFANDPIGNLTYVPATVVDFHPGVYRVPTKLPNGWDSYVDKPAFVSVRLQDGGVYAASLPPSSWETFKPGQEVIACVSIGKITHKVVEVAFVSKKPSV